jgi:hypothetical protein
MRAGRSLEGSLFTWGIAALLLWFAAVAHAADVTAQFSIARSGFTLNRTTNTFDQTVTLRNVSGSVVSPPLIVVVGGLAPSVTLANKAGQTLDGKPYVSPAIGTGLANGASLSLVLKFANPQRIAIVNTLQILNTIDLPPDAPSLIGAIATGGTNAFLIGRVVGASNLPITVQVTTSATCIAGLLAGGAVAGAPVPVTTDAAGYFGIAVSSVSPGAFVAVNVVSPTVTAMSACLVSSRDNDSWPKAFPLDGSPVSAQDLIDTAGKARWYKFDVLPGQRIEVRLTGLPADYDVAVFKDIGQAFAKQFTPGSATPTDLLKLTAEYAPSVFSPSVFSPSVFSPSVFSPSVFSPSVFSPSVFSPSVFSPSVFSPSVFSPSVFSPSVFSPSVFSPSVFSPSVFSSQELAQAFSTAQTRSVISVAATPGTSDEAAVVNTWNNTGSFYVRVVGHNGAFDTSTPFTVTVTKGATTCVNVTDTGISRRSRVTATGLQTVILTDSSRLTLDAPLNVPGGGTLRDKLDAFARRVDIAGVVVDVATDDRVRALKVQAANNPACPFAKNLVAEEIKSIVDSYRANPLRFVVVAGNDDAIPFFRFPDESGLGQESGYVPPVESNSPSEASLRLDYVLGQDDYGSATSLSLTNNDFPIPALAVGRLIETPDEIARIIDGYVAANGVVAPKSSLVTGYDFLADAASAVRDELAQGTGVAPDALITPNGKSPQDPASWTAMQLGQHLFGARHDVIFLAGHFSANSALAADFATSLLTTDLVASTTDFTNSIVFSAGCHSGYNLVDGDAIAGVTQPLDWAQAFARKGATLVAGTGYQYGDTDFLEYSERIYDNFARQLRAGTGAVAIGEALVKAKLDYLAITPDIRGLHEKALLEATLFGLPMLGVDMPQGRGAASGTTPVITATAISNGPAVTLGLKSFDLTVAPTLAPHSVTLKNTQGGADVVATWLSGPDGVVTRPGEPALPLAAVNVTPTDVKTVLRGVGFRAGSYTDVAPMFPFSGAPTTELRGIHFPFVSPTFYPARLFTPNYFGALAGSGGTQLLVTPVQHRVASVADGTSTQRSYQSLTFRLFYSGNLTQAALSDAPSLVGVDAKPDGAGILFTAQVVGDPAAGIQQVWVTYTSDASNAWTSLDLAQCIAPLPAQCGAVEDSRVWKGRLASAPPDLRYFAQAASGVGLVTLDDNRGGYYGVIGAPAAITSFALDPLPGGATFGDTIVISGTLSAGGVPVAGKLVTLNVGGTTQVGMTDASGRVSVQVPGIAATGTFQVTAAFAGDEATSPSSASTPLVVGKATSTLTALATAGATLNGVVNDNGVPLQGESVAFAVDGPGGPRTIFAIADYRGEATLPPPTGLPAGSYTVSQALYAGNSKYASTSISLTQQFVVPKTPQGIDFAPLPDKTLGEADFPLHASASSLLAVSYAASGNCTVSADIVHLTASGPCTITASQPGSADYDPAAPVSQTFSIAPNGKAEQVIAFGAPPSSAHVGDPPITVSATSSSPTAPPSGIPITFSSLTPAICTTGGTGTVTLVAAGTCTIAADEAGDANYNPAPQATLSFTVSPAGGGNIGAFTVTGAMGAGRSDHTATLLDDGRVLVAGGFGVSATVLASTELYCPDNASSPPDFVVCPVGQRGTFVAAAPLPVPAAGQTATRLHDGRVLLIGGANSALQSFTPTTQAWTSATDALADRTFHTATLLASGNVFIAGGVNAAGQTLATTFIVDTSRSPFTVAQGPDLAVARESQTATLLPDGTVLIAGGRRALPIDFAISGDYELYDPSVAGPRGNGAITTEGAMSRARFWHAAEIAGLRVVVTGGACDTASAVATALSSTEFFSFSAGLEPAVACNAPGGSADLQQGRRALTLTGLPDGTLLAIGGADATGAPRASAELFDALSSTFALGPSLTDARSEHAATQLLDGRVLVTGGVGASGAPLASAEIFSGAGGAGGPSNQRPIANAGPDQTVSAGATVQLDGSGSSDPEGRQPAFFWTFTSRPAVSTAQLTHANTVRPSFVADVAGTYIVQLVVNDGGSPPLDSAPDSVTITTVSGNRAPVANGDAYSVAQDTTLEVNAASGVLANDTDADGDPLTAAIVNVPVHGVVALNANGSFTYSPAAGYSGPDSFTYTANDGKANSNVATVSLIVTPVTPTNHAPVANAGSDQSVTVGQTVQLAGSCSDADNDPTTSTFSLTSKPVGSAATLSSATILNPTLTADLAGTYQAQLICNDGKVDSAPSTVTITAASSGAIALGLANASVVGIGSSTDVTVTLPTPAPAGGVVVTLSSDDASIVGVTTANVTVQATQAQATATISGIAAGSTTLRASAAGYTQGSLGVTVVPTTLTVTNLDDSGPGSLRDAIALANGAPDANTVVFASGLTGTIVLTSGQIRISSQMTIVGPGAGALAIDGGLNGRIFTVIEDNAPACPALSGPSDFVVSISGLTLQHGSRNVVDSGGGAIQSAKSLMLDSVTIRDSQAKSGGALVFNAQYPGQILSITNSQFINNVAKPVVAGNTDAHNGGALLIHDYCDGVHISATVNIGASVFSGNRVQPVDLEGRGGAIAAFLATGTFAIADSRIVDNHVEPPNPPVAGLSYPGGGMQTDTKLVSVQRTEIAGNSANFGGGLDIAASDPDLQGQASTFRFELLDSTVSGNSANQRGGGVEIYGNVAALIANSTVAANSAPASFAGGVRLNAGATVPPSASNTATPTLQLVSSILADSLNGSVDLAHGSGIVAPISVDTSNSLVETADADIVMQAATNLFGVDPRLGALADNGGLTHTRTHALQAGSPAIDAGTNPLGLSTDQRGAGFARTLGNATDIGAFESAFTGNRAPVASAGADQSGTVGQPVQLAGSCTDADNDPTTPTWSFASKPAASVAALSSTSILNPTFTPDVAGTYRLQLICNDGKIDSAPSTMNVTVGATTSLALDNTGLVGIGRADSFGITVSGPAPAGGLVVTLTSDNAGVYAITTPTVTVPAGQTHATGSGTGVGNGTTTLRASAPGYAQGTIAQSVTSNIAIVIGPVDVPLGASAPMTVTVIPAAPAGGLQLTLSSDTPGVATTTLPSITIPAGQTTATATVNGLGAGTAHLSASAPGYAEVAGTVNTVGATAPVQWTVASGGNGHWYQFVSSLNGFTWDAARISATGATFLGMSGYLATITSQGEQDFLFALAKYPSGATGTLFDPANPGVSLGTVSIAGRDALAWLGGSDLGAEGVWRWRDGPETGSVFWNGNAGGSAPPGVFAFWNAGQPDDFNGSEDFLQFRYSGGRWNDSPTGTMQPLEGTNPDGTATRASLGYLVEYSPPAAPVTTYTVTNLNDGGVGSLRDAITQANQAPGPATVTFAAGLTGTITLSSHIQISGPVTIVGPGADKVMIDAGNETGSDGRVFSIFVTDPACPAIDGPDYLVSISGLTLANALNTFANTGGAIFSEHSLAIDSVIIRDSVSRQGAGVGMLVQYPGQTLTISNSQFLGNFARPVAVTGTTTLSGQQGVGVYVVDRCSGTRVEPVTVSITGSVFSGNRAQPTTLVGRGGAVTVFSHADTTIVDTKIVDNHVDVPNPPVAGLSYRGAGFYGTGKSLRIERSEISDNTIVDVTASDQTRGGGISLFNDPADLQAPASAMNVTIVNSTISGNSVPATAGALWAFGNVALEIDNSTIANNVAGAGRTGGILLTSGATTPAGSTNATAPTLNLVSSILVSNAASATDISTNTAVIPSFTVDATRSLVKNVCSTCNITLSGSGNLAGADPLLAPLSDNGGPTRTHALLAGSPAIDAGGNPLALATDQRGAGFPRVVGAAADIGAYESGNAVNAINLSVQSVFVAIGGTTAGTIMLPTPAPAGGVDVALASSAPSIATASPAVVSIPQGAISAPFTINGIAQGGARISASATGYNGAFVDVSVTANVVTVGSVSLAPEGSGSFPVTLSQAAPAGGLTVTLASGNTSVVTVPASVFIAAGTAAANPNPIATAVGLGTTTIAGTAPNYAPGSGVASVTLTATLTPNPLSVVQNGTAQITLTLSQAAPAGGITVNLSTDNSSIASVPATVAIAQGNLSAQVTVTGIAAGQSTVLHASSAGLADTSATINVVTAPAITVFGGVTIGKDLEAGDSFFLEAPAPAGNLVVTLTSSDPANLLLSQDPTAAGAASVTVTVGAGNSSGSFYIHALAGSGGASVTASASGYANGTATLTFVPSGFFSDVPGGDFTTNQLASNTPLRVCVGQLDPVTHDLLSYGQLRGNLGVSVAMTSSDPGVGTIVNSPYTFNGGDSCSLYTGGQVGLQFDPVGAGTTRLTVVPPAGFTAPGSRASFMVTVGNAGIDLLSGTLGQNLQNAWSGSLQASAPAGGVDVTLTSADPSKLRIAPDAFTAGTSPVTIHVAEGQQVFTYYAQGFASSGVVHISATAPGFGSGSGNATLVPSGFFSDIPGGDFTTNQLALATPLRVCVGELDPASLGRTAYGTLRAGFSADVTLASSDPAVGTIVNSPYTFNGGDACSLYSGGQVGLQFDPAAAGTTTVSVIAPTGFSTPSSQASYTATVGAAAIDLFGGGTTLGKDLEKSVSGQLQAPAPANGVNLTLTSGDPGKLLLSPDATTAGTSSITLNVPAGSQAFAFYAHGLASSSSVQIGASAPGFGNGSTSFTLVPSGFFSDVPGGDFATNQLAVNTPLRVCVAELDPQGTQRVAYGQLRGGLSVDVAVTSSNTNVGSIVNSPYRFNGGDVCSIYTGGQVGLQFDPVGTGTTTLAVVQPSGFSTSSAQVTFTASVGVAGIDLVATTVGKDLEASGVVTLQAPAPAGGVDVTLTSADPSKVILASDATTAGTSSITVNVPEGQQNFGYYSQALANSGIVQIGASATGFGNGSTTVTLVPSGFFTDSPGDSFTTSTADADTSIRVCVAQLDPTTLNVGTYGQMRGGITVQTPMTSSNTNIGTIVNSPIAFTGGIVCDPNYGSPAGLRFHPVTPGATTLSVGTPSGFSTPSNRGTTAVTVN